MFEGKNLIWEKLLKFETILDARNWITNVFVGANALLGSKTASKNMIVVDEVKKYVGSNYDKNLTLESVASALHYSPNYLNYIFKKETGETIFEYVCRFKMEKAKEMLADPRIKLYEIADTLGYSHSAYFSSVFKKFTGLTPKEYRERCFAL